MVTSLYDLVSLVMATFAESPQLSIVSLYLEKNKTKVYFFADCDS